MSAYKQFSTKDVIITPFSANKGFSFYGGQITGSDNSNGINILFGTQPPNKLISDSKNTNGTWIYSGQAATVSGSLNLSGITTQRNNFAIYSSVKQLFYTNYLSSSWGDTVATRSLIAGADPEGDSYIGSPNTPNFENYLQSTLIQSRSLALGEQYFGTQTNPSKSYNSCTVISIPSKLYGNAIEPQSFSYSGTSSQWPGAYFTYDLYDDGNGNIFTRTFDLQGSSGTFNAPDFCIGNIFYDKGLIVLPACRLSGSGTGSGWNEEGMLYPNTVTANIGNRILDGQDGYISTVGDEPTLSSASIHFSSSVKIYEHQYKCTIRENEFNYSLNPSLLSSSLDTNITTVYDPINSTYNEISSSQKSINQKYYSFATGSYFSPYITTVGLYDNNKQLLALGKLSRPTKIPTNSDLTIQINFDM